MDIKSFAIILNKNKEDKMIEATLPIATDISQLSEMIMNPANPVLKKVIAIAKKYPYLQRVLKNAMWDIDNNNPEAISIKKKDNNYIVMIGSRSMSIYTPEKIYNDIEAQYNHILKNRGGYEP